LTVHEPKLFSKYERAWAWQSVQQFYLPY